MNMNKNGTISANQRAKLLAGFVAIAMVVCVLCAVLPSSDAVDETSADTDILQITNGGQVQKYTYAQLDDAIAAINAAEGAITVDVLNNFTANLTDVANTKAAIVLSNNNPDAAITINGHNHTITGFGTVSPGVSANIINVEYSAADFTISDLVIDGGNLGHHGFNIYDVSGAVTLDGITSTNNTATGITLNQADNVVANGVTVTNNPWGAINVDHGSKLVINGNNNLGDGFQIWSEDANTAETGSSVTGDAFNDYKYGWEKPSEDVTNGAIWFANGTVTGDFVLGGGNNITIPADMTLTVAPGASLTVESGSTLATEEGAEVTGNVVNNGVQVETDSEGAVVASVADFASLQAAVANADVDRIELVADITFTDHLNTQGKKIDLKTFDMILGNYTLNAYSAGTGAITVPNGSIFSFSGMVKMTEDGLVTEEGSRIVYASSTANFYNFGGSSAPGETDFYPLFAPGAKVTFQNSEYTISHYAYNNETVQYGLTHSPVYYTGNEVTDRDIDASIQVFDTTGQYNATVLDWQLVGGPYVDAGIYDDAIDVRVAISKEGQSAGTSSFTSIPLVISARDISADAVVTVEEPNYYTGQQVTPGVTVTYNGNTLTEGVDYELDYGENIAETGTVTVNFTGNYAGTVTKEFEILEEYTNLVIKTQPNKTNYYVGEKVDLTGMVVEATKESTTGTVEILAYDPDHPDTPGYTVDIEYVSADTTQIVISYVNASGETLTAPVLIKVTQIESIAVTDVNTESVYDKEYSVGESINVNNMKVTVTYTDKKIVVFNGSEAGFVKDGGNSNASTGTFSTEITFDPETLMATGEVDVTPMYFGFSGTVFTVNVTGGLAQYVYFVENERVTYATQAGADGDNIAVYGFAKDYVPVVGQEFVGWNVEGTGVIYQPGDMIEVNGDSNMWVDGVITLVAVFGNPAGGNDDQPTAASENILVSVVPTETGFNVYLVSLDGGYIPGDLSITGTYYFTYQLESGATAAVPVPFEITEIVSVNGQTIAMGSFEFPAEVDIDTVIYAEASFGGFDSARVMF